MTMKIRFHKSYLKAEERIGLFLEDRSDSRLKDHPLTGNLKDKRAFSVTGDYRIIYQEIEGELVLIFLDIGTHSQVY